MIRNILLSIILVIAPLCDLRAQRMTLTGAGLGATVGGTTTITYQSGRSGQNINAAGTTVAVTVTLTAGDLVIVDFSHGTPSASLTSLSDAGCSDTFTARENYNFNFASKQYSAIVATGGSCTITATWGSSSYLQMRVSSFTSNTGWPAAVSDQGGTASVSGTTGTLTMTATGANTKAVVVAVCGVGQNQTNNFGATVTGFTQGLLNASNFGETWYRVTSGIETSSCAITVGPTSAAADGVLNTYKPN